MTGHVARYRVRPTDRPAFTVIELIVVMSIIILLIAMLLPALRNAREVAREAICASNMKQVVNANLSYANDNDGSIPANRYMPWPGQNYHVTWRWMVWKHGYIDKSDAWNCPSPQSTEPRAEDYGIHGSIDCVDDPANPSGPPGDLPTNYAFNGRMFWRYGPNGSPDNPNEVMTRKKEAKVSQIKSPSNTFMILETTRGYPDLGEWTVSWIDADGITGPNGYWHRLGANWAICDGHVEWKRLLDTGVENCMWHDPGPADAVDLPAGHGHTDWINIAAPIYRVGYP